MSKAITRRKLSQFAKDEGIKYASAYKYWKENALEGIQLKSGTILVEGWKKDSLVGPENEPNSNETIALAINLQADLSSSALSVAQKIAANETVNAIVYSRASFADKKEDIRSTSTRLAEIAVQLNYHIVDVVEEVGLAYSTRRVQLSALLARDDWDVLIVESKEELLKFGSPYIEILLKRLGKVILSEVDYLNPQTFEESNSDRELNTLIQRTRTLIQGLVGLGKQKALIDEVIQELIK